MNNINGLYWFRGRFAEGPRSPKSESSFKYTLNGERRETETSGSKSKDVHRRERPQTEIRQEPPVSSLGLGHGSRARPRRPRQPLRREELPSDLLLPRLSKAAQQASRSRRRDDARRGAQAVSEGTSGREARPRPESRRSGEVADLQGAGRGLYEGPASRSEGKRRG
jgi:hypothetical protein